MDEAGDPYRAECRHTVAALESRLGLAMGSLTATFQSVFGRAEWLGPQTIEEMAELGAAKCPRVDVICPGFMADCLETLEEIDQLNRETFVEAGGRRLPLRAVGERLRWCGRCLGRAVPHRARRLGVETHANPRGDARADPTACA